MPFKVKEVAAAIFTLAIVVTGAKLGSDLKTERKVAKVSHVLLVLDLFHPLSTKPLVT